RRCASVVMRGILATALGCIMAISAPRPAAAEMEIAPAQLAGRWSITSGSGSRDCSEPGCRPTYDLVPCGEGWCGIEGKDGKTCGRMAFRLTAIAPSDNPRYGAEFAGTFERAEGTQHYVVRANLFANPTPEQPAPPLRLSVRGNTGGDFQPFRRTYP